MFFCVSPCPTSWAHFRDYLISEKPVWPFEASQALGSLLEAPVLGPSKTPGCLRGSLSKPIGKKAQEAQKGPERIRITINGKRRARRSKPNKLMKGV